MISTKSHPGICRISLGDSIIRCFMIWKSEPSGFLAGRRGKGFGTIPFVNKVYFLWVLWPLAGSEIKNVLRSSQDLKNSVHYGEKFRRSLIIILCCCQHAYSVSKLPQHNLRWKFSDQNFSYKSKKLGLKPVAQARFFLFPVTGLWVTHTDGLDLDLGTRWKGKTHFPPFVWPLKEISLFSNFFCACKLDCSLAVPSSPWASLNWSSGQAGWLVLGPHYPRPPLLPCSSKYTYLGTCMARLPSTFSQDLSPEFLEFFHLNSPGMDRYYPPFMDVKTEVQV